MQYPNQFIEDLLTPYKEILGVDYEKYSHHVCRVFLNCIALDNDQHNEEKYAVAAVFHDIGIWTKQTMDYLDPSIELAELYLSEEGKQDWVEEVSNMIYYHHKLRRYKGDDAATVEVFRKADWIDVLPWLFRFGISRKLLKENRRKFPDLGFHLFLFKRIISYAFSNPFLNPLPMVKK